MKYCHPDVEVMVGDLVEYVDGPLPREKCRVIWVRPDDADQSNLPPFCIRRRNGGHRGSDVSRYFDGDPGFEFRKASEEACVWNIWPDMRSQIYFTCRGKIQLF